VSKYLVIRNSGVESCVSHKTPIRPLILPIGISLRIIKLLLNNQSQLKVITSYIVLIFCASSSILHFSNENHDKRTIGDIDNQKVFSWIINN
jgi:hypothetical protein